MKANFSINQGEDFKCILTLKDELGVPINLVGHIFTGQIRRTASSGRIEAEFDFVILDQSDLETLGKVEMILTASASSAINMTVSRTAKKCPTQLVYDVESKDVDENLTTRWLEGIIELSPEVTR